MRELLQLTKSMFPTRSYKLGEITKRIREQQAKEYNTIRAMSINEINKLGKSSVCQK